MAQLVLTTADTVDTVAFLDGWHRAQKTIYLDKDTVNEEARRIILFILVNE